jgi:hypothetical protein
MKIFLCFSVFILTSSTITWEVIGSTNFGFKSDVFIVPVTYSTNIYNGFRVSVIGKEINIKNIKVLFENGDSNVFKVNNKIDAGGKSQTFDLSAFPNIIKSIEVQHKVKSGMVGNGTLNVWGYIKTSESE